MNKGYHETKNKIVKQERDISNIMKYLNLKVKMKRRYKNTTDSNHNLPIAANILNRGFYASTPDEIYVGDRSVNKKIFEYIEFYYNRVRSHSYLGNLSLVKFEEKHKKEKVLQFEMVD
jgi:transposase InsO family protein